MSNIIEFLERLGRDADLRRGGPQALSDAMDAAQLTPEERAAILSQQPEDLAASLGAQHKLHCLVYAPEETRPPPPPSR